MMYYERGDAQTTLSDEDLREGLFEALSAIGARDNVLALPPDFTRFHSKAGTLTSIAYEYYRDKLTDVLPALGTHSPMTDRQIATMFAGVPAELVRVHRFREDVVTLGRVPADFIREVSEGKLDYDWPAQVNRMLTDRRHELVLSIGQIVPHEVVGMANHNKNVFIGTGGSEGINKSHFLGAVYGMERMMGRADTPVRRVLDYASEHFATDIPIVYVLTVVGRNEDGELVVRGLFVGDGKECYYKAAELSLEVNFSMLDEELETVVVYLDPDEFKSTWLGNKSVYRTRMAIADGGELIVLAPGVREFGEDKEIDRLIRKYGYKRTPEILAAVDDNEDLKGNLSAAAHLIHGSSEDRFTITYCPAADGLTREEVEGVNFSYAPYEQITKTYNPERLRDGWNEGPDGRRVYYISNPAIGLWSYRDRFKD